MDGKPGRVITVIIQTCTISINEPLGGVHGRIDGGAEKENRHEKELDRGSIICISSGKRPQRGCIRVPIVSKSTSYAPGTDTLLPR